eukprot:47268-Eustigmatos_ZCMA.PRE.1
MAATCAHHVWERAQIVQQANSIVHTTWSPNNDCANLSTLKICLDLFLKPLVTVPNLVHPKEARTSTSSMTLPSE